MVIFSALSPRGSYGQIVHEYGSAVAFFFLHLRAVLRLVPQQPLKRMEHSQGSWAEEFLAAQDYMKVQPSGRGMNPWLSEAGCYTKIR
jgi:hypothetical protein